MTEIDVQQRMFDTFCSLDTFAREHGYTGEPFLEQNAEGNYLNVHFPNRPFDYPESKRWFELTFRNNEPTDAALMEGTQYRFTGLLYIDIIIPQDVEEYEAVNKYCWIARLFHSVNIDVVDSHHQLLVYGEGASTVVAHECTLYIHNQCQNTILHIVQPQLERLR